MATITPTDVLVPYACVSTSPMGFHDVIVQPVLKRAHVRQTQDEEAEDASLSIPSRPSTNFCTATSDATHSVTDVTSAVVNGCRTNVARYTEYPPATTRARTA